MSFAATVRDELCRVDWTCEDCKVAELSALIRIDGNLSANYRIEIATETASEARRIVGLLHELYSLKTEITTRKSVLHKSYNYLITVPAQIGLKEALDNLGIITEIGLDLGLDPKLVRKDCCKVAYIRGAFIGGGFIADPNGDFHLEFTTAHEELANALVELLVDLGLPAKSTRRRNSVVIYLKGADSIVELIGMMGANRAVLDMESVRVTKSVRNDVNRRLNAEMANQAKTIDAAMDQVKTIKMLIDSGGLESMSPALQELALLRLANPEASIRELGELANPPLSKSAVYHRIRRLESMAREILE